MLLFRFLAITSPNVLDFEDLPGSSVGCNSRCTDKGSHVDYSSSPGVEGPQLFDVFADMEALNSFQFFCHA